jgi:RNA polymerase sigma factor (sigma-70 family)
MEAVEPAARRLRPLARERNPLSDKRLGESERGGSSALSRPPAPAVRPASRRAVSPSDTELIQAVREGQRERFHDLVRRHAAPLWSTIRRSVRDVDDARDVLQETWVRALERLGDLREPERLRSWLLSIALNLVRELRRRRPFEALPEEPDSAPASGRWDGSVGGKLELADDARAVRAEIERLPPRQREVFDLRLNHELAHAEIAALLGIAEEASRASLYQALRRLRARFPENPA